jgi:hypothetical protein
MISFQDEATTADPAAIVAPLRDAAGRQCSFLMTK